MAQDIAVNRRNVGLIALGCLLASLAIWWFRGGSEEWILWQAGFQRVGLVLGAIWLALPTRNREAAWANISPLALIGSLIALLAVVSRPRAVLPIIPVVVVIFVLSVLLRPKPRYRPPRDS